MKLTELRPMLWTENLHETVEFYKIILRLNALDLMGNWG